jgi:ribonuclease D
MHVILTTSELAEACARLAKHPFVAVDTEFLREETYWPNLCLVQMAGPDEALIVDPLAKGIDLAPLYALMADKSTLKVFHAGRQDIEIFHVQAGIVPEPIFDTQVAAMVCGHGESVSYGNLVKRIVNVDVDKSSRFTDWSRRPLSATQLEYALADVTHLRVVYASLAAELESTGRVSWLGEEMSVLTDPATYRLAPEDAWRRLKTRVKNRKAMAALVELAAWREEQAQAQNVPRPRVLRDEALYDIANRMPTETKQLDELRTLSNGFSRSARAKDIVDAVKRGLARDPKTVPAQPAGNAVTAEAGALVDLLRVLLKAAAAKHRVAPKMISDTADLERIAMEKEPDVAALKGWRYEMFGNDALRLKRGEIALTVTNGEVATTPLSPKSVD